MSWYPPGDGKQFVAALEKKGVANCYVDFFESDDVAKVKKEAKAACEREGRKAIVFERGNTVIFRYPTEG